MASVRFNRASIAKLFSEEVKTQLEKKASVLLEDLKEATPVLTGKARDSWAVEVDRSTKDIVVTNSQDYIEILNQGSSKQAPRYFIERVLLNNGFKVKGLAITKK